MIDLNQLIVMPLFDAVPAEPNGGYAQSNPNESFNDYLQRARTSSADAGQSSASRAEESNSAGAAPTSQNNGEDEISDTESEEQRLESKQELVEADSAASRTDKEEKDDKKDNRDGGECLLSGKNQDNRPNAQINPEAIDVKSSERSVDNTLTAQTEIKGAPDSLQVTCKDAKNIVDTGMLTTTESLTATASQVGVVNEVELPVSESKKGGTSKKIAALDGESMEILSADQQASKTISALLEGETSLGKISKDNFISTHDTSRRTSRQSEKKGSPAARLAEAAATVSSAASQDASAGAAAADSAVAQAVVDAPTTLAKLIEADIVNDKNTNISPNKNADATTNDALRLGTASTKTAAGEAQHKGEGAASQLHNMRFVQRVERAFAAMGDRGGMVRLKLSPPELGSVRMEISVNKGVMNARIEAETKEAKNMLLENLPALRDRLAQHNIKIQKFDVDLRDPSSGGMSQQTANQAETGSQDGGYRAARPRIPEKTAASAPAAETARLADHSGQLNVII